MDYTSYFAPPPYYVGLPPTPSPSYDNAIDKDLDSFLSYHAFSSYPAGAPPPPVQQPIALSLEDMELDLNALREHAPSPGLPGSNTTYAHNNPHHHHQQPRARSTSSTSSSTSSPPGALATSTSPTTTTTSTTALTPAQSRRKAQNRAAQRAFRERKEKHVRELEAKLAELEASAQGLATDNERLRLLLQRADAENEILRVAGALAAVGAPGSPPLPGSPPRGGEEGEAYIAVRGRDGRDAGAGAGVVTGTLERRTASSTSRRSAAASRQGQKEAHREAGHGNGNGKLLSAEATWDLLQAHPLVAAGVVDIADVSERLRGMARCSGTGPVFEEGVVLRVVEEARRGGGGGVLC